MHLAILMTNTDDSAFADAHPGDGAKFTSLVQIARPEWSTDVFSVKDGVFPEDLSAFDGVMITGSPASARDDAPWVAELLQMIRQIADAKLPMFGACFGHQAIALALSGTVGLNPGGIIHQLTHTHWIARPRWADTMPEDVKLFASHKEQVMTLPKDARAISAAPGCPIGGFAIDSHVYTTQHHPEMTEEFFAALTLEIAPDIGSEMAEHAQATLVEQADMSAYADSIAKFFECDSSWSTEAQG